MVHARKDEPENGITKHRGVRIVRIECAPINTLLDECDKSSKTHSDGSVSLVGLTATNGSGSYQREGGQSAK